MNCKHEDGDYVLKFWRLFNEAFKEVNKTDKRFSPRGWITDMASANFNGLAVIYGEDVLSKIKGCEFHFKLSVERKAKSLGDNAEKFKQLSYDMLISTTPEAYEHALNHIKTFSENHPELSDWIAWWDSRKDNIFRAFTGFDTPQSNLAEVIHAGWKHRDRMGVSLLECCYFDIRDSILLTTSLENMEKGSYDGGFGPSEATRKSREQNRQTVIAGQIGKDILDFNVTQADTKNSKKRNRKENDGCNPPKKARNNERMFSKRLETANNLKDVMKIKKVVKISTMKRQFNILSTESGRVTYIVEICNAPSCTCPDFRKNGAVVLCKHMMFVLKYVLKQNDEVLRKQHIGDEDVKAILTNDKIDETYMKRDIGQSNTRAKDIREILLHHPAINNDQMCTLQRKSNRTAKCRGCGKCLTIGSLAVKVDGALAVPYGKTKAVLSTFYFCPDRHCFSKIPNWCNVKIPTTIQHGEDISQTEIDNARQSLGIS